MTQWVTYKLFFKDEETTIECIFDTQMGKRIYEKMLNESDIKFDEIYKGDLPWQN